MGTITLSVPDELKLRMDEVDIINWSSVARHAFAETLEDIEELRIRKRIQEISGISEDDNREVKESVVKEVIKSVEKTSKELKSGERKAMTPVKFKAWCESL